MEEYEQFSFEVLNTNSWAGYNCFLYIQACEENPSLLKDVFSFPHTPEFHCIACELFHLFYLDDSSKEYIFYLLHQEFVRPCDLSFSEIRNLFRLKKWGRDYILKNLDSLALFRTEDIASMMVLEVKDDKSLYNRCLNRVLESDNALLRFSFFKISIEEGVLFDSLLLVESLYQNVDDFFYSQEACFMKQDDPLLLKSCFPSFLAKTHMYSELIKKYFSLFFMAEEREKMKFVTFLNYIEEDTLKKYPSFFRFYEIPFVRRNLDFIFSSIVNAKECSFLDDYIQNDSISFEKNGTRAYAFRIGNNRVIKFSEGKYNTQTITEHFLLAATKFKIIPTIYYPLYIECQPYLKKEYQGKYMTDEDISNFMNEIDRQGLCLCDPRCLEHDFDNFGFLENYQDANLCGVSSYEELPEWFRKRPLVLYDIDMVSRKREKE